MQTQTAYQVNVKEGLLRNTLRGNAIFSVISGLLFTFAAGPVVTFMGIPSTLAVVIMGIVLFPFAYTVYRVASQTPLNVSGAKTIIGMDVTWVVASYIFLFVTWSMLTVGGKWFVALQAEAIFLFALFQTLGLRRIQRQD